MVDLAGTIDLFRRHVLDGTDQLPLLGLSNHFMPEVGQAEVEYLEHTFAVQHHVPRLDVAVNHPHRVRIVQGRGGLNQDVDYFRNAKEAMAGDLVRKRVSVDKLHHQIMNV